MAEVNGERPLQSNMNRRTTSSKRTNAPAPARAPAPSGVPLQLICYNSETGLIEIGQEAIKALKAVKGPVGVVAVCGRARTGKSYILNQLLGESAGFTVAASYRPCTKGLWLWSAPVQRVGPDGAPYHLILLDSEGIDAYNQVRAQPGWHMLPSFVVCLVCCIAVKAASATAPLTGTTHDNRHHPGLLFLTATAACSPASSHRPAIITQGIPPPPHYHTPAALQPTHDPVQISSLTVLLAPLHPTAHYCTPLQQFLSLFCAADHAGLCADLLPGSAAVLHVHLQPDGVHR